MEMQEIPKQSKCSLSVVSQQLTGQVDNMEEKKLKELLCTRVNVKWWCWGTQQLLYIYQGSDDHKAAIAVFVFYMWTNNLPGIFENIFFSKVM